MDREMDYDMSRADLMTPFSLSLAAEKAIESAKRQLDAMDERLLKARMAMARAQRTSQVPSLTATGTRAFFTTTPAPSRTEHGDRDWERKATELKRLKDDLKALRSRMNIARGLDSAIDPSTPSRPVRPGDFDVSQYKHDNDVIHAFPKPPSSSNRSSMSPICVDAPFSPRPYSSQSILPPFSATSTTFTTTTNDAAGLDKSVRGRAHEGYHTPPHSSPSSQKPNPGTQGKAPDTPQSMHRTSPSSIPRHRTSSSVRDGDGDGDEADREEEEEREGSEWRLLARVETALARINDVTDERRKRKLAAALAILEDSEEE
ncbi:protein of unknown function [Taphrina deformans PYCC 5710]|uniref:Uncharacterized protein n=1 Tax=Taphrina deformans (strain PYCC 5710 / ATCC 11124 / CBS 356.35 / IMI 108563 / JCM 9778 / NBRC 8474) TaxID=1097556 RepID=R4X7T3_TAPDE|nr:protein of unknown function [Taphrina deformans PYCC 5710]|eukprot:CCG81253.1 protein of unknown function [Taphrina deformans PYCC 5710]